MNTANNSDRWIDNLLQVEAFPHPVGALQLIETHISWIVLTGDFAYKVKKPVELGFLDFSTTALRKHFCQQELALNQRFAKDLYLQVVTITGSRSHPRIGGDGEVFDYALKMRQFDNNLQLDNLASQGRLSTAIIDQLAIMLARLHSQLPSANETLGRQTAANFFAAAMQNFEQIQAYNLPQDKKVALANAQTWQRSAYQQLLPTLHARQEDGFVKDCHGDCHLGNIAIINNQVTLFDCIEFNDSFRLMDTMAEAAFLSMDLCAHQLQQHSQRFLNGYLEYRGDYAGLALLNLYRSYYALVRAKVHLVKSAAADASGSAQSDRRRALEYLSLADQFTASRTPRLILMHGFSGSGKSWLAEHLMTFANTFRVRSDVERKRLFNRNGQANDVSQPVELYGKQASNATFARLLELVASVTTAGFNCIVDATFISRSRRQPFLQLAKKRGIAVHIVSCYAEESVIRQRLRQRSEVASDPSDADFEIYQRQTKNFDPLEQEELRIAITIDTTQGDCVSTAANSLGLTTP